LFASKIINLSIYLISQYKAVDIAAKEVSGKIVVGEYRGDFGNYPGGTSNSRMGHHSTLNVSQIRIGATAGMLTRKIVCSA